MPSIYIYIYTLFTFKTPILSCQNERCSSPPLRAFRKQLVLPKSRTLPRHKNLREPVSSWCTREQHSTLKNGMATRCMGALKGCFMVGIITGLLFFKQHQIRSSRLSRLRDSHFVGPNPLAQFLDPEPRPINLSPVSQHLAGSWQRKVTVTNAEAN